ncbi:hypothetical protein [Parablautia muri]|uniref:Uncharacterized protein n=1 Tax=Parablautia muri TaxID=2320879 RepID=A0A9X5GQE6_9FIRM|nr:hypothetical protein [Parablautia muri]NBJ91104.1 hypothetical protein [Parablautia muri]
MKRKAVSAVIFILSLAVFLISGQLFWNMGVFVDEYNTTPSAVCGGEFWLLMDWARLLASGMLVLLSGMAFFRKK